VFSDGVATKLALRSCPLAHSLGASAIVNSSHGESCGLLGSSELLVEKVTLRGGVILSVAA
jgi:hypothetical protein